MYSMKSSYFSQNIPVGDELTHVGYNISKHGLVALTRYFGALEHVNFFVRAEPVISISQLFNHTKLYASRVSVNQ
jgi:hypothetical protein